MQIQTYDLSISCICAQTLFFAQEEFPFIKWVNVAIEVGWSCGQHAFLLLKWIPVRIPLKSDNSLASGCGSVGRVVALDTRGRRSNSVFGKKISRTCLLLAVKINKEAGKGPF